MFTRRTRCSVSNVYSDSLPESTKIVSLITMITLHLLVLFKKIITTTRMNTKIIILMMRNLRINKMKKQKKKLKILKSNSKCSGLKSKITYL
jgi:hypothetical protein